jgi:integrase
MYMHRLITIKTVKEKTIRPLEYFYQLAFNQLSGNTRFLVNELNNRLQRCTRKLITNFHFHDLRHTFASYLRQRGIDLHTISKLLGHKDTRMTNRYSHLSVDSLRNAISVLDQTATILLQSENEKKTINA